MDFRLKPEEEAFRDNFILWLEKNLPDDWDPSNDENYPAPEKLREACRFLQGRLFGAGYAAVHYPQEYGGQGRSALEEILVFQILGSTCLELFRIGFVTHFLVAPIILAYGREDQKKEFLPKIFNGDHLWCQGFSEPGAGSDLGQISTQARREDNHYVINGQKVWTSFAQMADYCLLFLRTDPDSSGHKGLSQILVDLRLPGVEVKPLKQITGESMFNEIFLDEVRVPVEMRIGEEGQGWQIALSTLMFERASGDMIISAMYEKNLERMIQMMNQCKRSGRPVMGDPVFRQQLAQAYIEVMVLKYHGLRNLSPHLQGKIPGPEGSIGKLLWSESNQRICQAALNMQGPGSQILKGHFCSVQQGFWQYQFLRSKASTIEEGTSEIQRNIIGERVLGLPKDASRQKDKKRGERNGCQFRSHSN